MPSATLRFAPQPGQAERLRDWVVQRALPELATKPGVTGVHLIENAVPAVPLDEQTAEQKLRGGDAVADWVLLVSGYDLELIAALAQDELQEQVLVRHGASPGRLAGVYRLAHSVNAFDQP